MVLDFPGDSDSKASVYNAGDPGSIPGLGRSPGEGNGNPLQYYCLENPMDPRGQKESDTAQRLNNSHTGSEMQSLSLGTGDKPSDWAWGQRGRECGRTLALSAFYIIRTHSQIT